jgi:hypothetical protein
MTKELQVGLPKLYDTEDTPTNDMILRIRYYDINSQWEWFLIEFEPETNIGFFYVRGFENEWGYSSLEEMQNIPSIVIDKKFRPIKFSELNKSKGRQ